MFKVVILNDKTFAFTCFTALIMRCNIWTQSRWAYKVHILQRAGAETTGHEQVTGQRYAPSLDPELRFQCSNKTE